MCPYIIEIGPVTIASFGLMVALGFLIAMQVLARELRQANIPESSEIASSIINTSLICGLVGAKAYFVMFETPNDLSSTELFDVIFSGYGLTWYGGFVCATLGVVWRLRSKKLPILQIADSAAIALSIGYAIGRIGCQLAGDGCYGMPTDLPWGMAYPDGVVPTFEKVHPAPVYETLSYLTIFFILKIIARYLLIPGHLFCIYMVLAGLARFVIETIRINPKVYFWGYSEAQLISIAIVTMGALFAGFLLVKPVEVKKE